MKNLLFSKKYLKTKLCLLTVIMTLLYHLFSREKFLFDNIDNRNSDFSMINEKKEKVFNNNNDKHDNDGKNIHNNSDINDNNDDFNLEIIPSDFLLDYWQSIKERKPSLKTPKISQGINPQSKFRKLDFSEFLESQILNDFIKVIKSSKYRKDGKNERWVIGKDLWVFLNVSRKIWTNLRDGIVGIPERIIYIFYFFRR